MEERLLRLRLLWLNPVPTQNDGSWEGRGDLDTPGGRPTEFGMQKGRSQLVSGVLQPDGSTAYETAAVAYQDKQSRLRFRGPCIQGPPDEPFLYLSYRFPGSPGWIGRGKAHLTSLTEEFIRSLPEGAVLDSTMDRLGHRGAGHVQIWQIRA